MSSQTHSQRSSIQQRVKAIRSSDLPLQAQESALLRLKSEAANIKESLFIQANADFISDIMANRNVEGSALERLHQKDKAIELYEANVKDRFENFLPYERLRILYSLSGKYMDAIRVCQAYIEYGHNDEVVKAEYREWIAKYAHAK